MDLHTGKAAIDAEVWPEVVPRTTLEKVSFAQLFISLALPHALLTARRSGCGLSDLDTALPALVGDTGPGKWFDTSR